MTFHAGVKSQLGYLREIGVTTISLSPIYRTSDGSHSDMDIVDHNDIAPEYGTMSQFISLVNTSHAHGEYKDWEDCARLEENNNGEDCSLFVENKA